MEFLTGGAFTSPVGQRIQKATSAALQTEDWSLNLEICDIINETDDGPKDAAKALKKRIVGNKNFREVMLALTVLEACVKNCGHRFHVLVCSREFVEGVMVRAILPKHNPPMVLHERVLSLIQAWADAFRNRPSLCGVVSVYEDLRSRGLEFPMTDLDSLSPIHTPNRSVPADGSTPALESSAHTHPCPADHADPAPIQRSGAVSAPQKQKLRAELDLVRGNLSVMTEMLNHATAGDTPAADAELLQQLYAVCVQMQQRLVELVPCLSEDELMADVLLLNDELNNAFIRYQRFERLNTQMSNTRAPQQTPTDAGLLIDLSPESPPANHSAPPAVSQPQPRPPDHSAVSHTQPLCEDEEFDMFAQTRSSSLSEQRKSVRYEDPGAVEGLAGALDVRLQVTAGAAENDWLRQSQWIYSEALAPAPHSNAMDEIERWLSAEMPDEDDTEGVTTEEFDKFLAGRAHAADHLPPATRHTHEQGHTQEQQHTHEQKHEQLFSL